MLQRLLRSLFMKGYDKSSNKEQEVLEVEFSWMVYCHKFRRDFVLDPLQTEIFIVDFKREVVDLKNVKSNSCKNIWY